MDYEQELMDKRTLFVKDVIALRIIGTVGSGA